MADPRAPLETPTRSHATAAPRRSFAERWLRLSQLDFPVPAHGARRGYTFGGMAFVGFLLLFMTGLLLTQFFDPAPERAYASVKRMLEWDATRFARSAHVWLADAVVLVLLLHMGRIIVTGAYKAPRIATWLVGVALFFIAVFGSYFTGTTLKGDQESIDGLAHMLAAAKTFPLAGELVEGAKWQPALTMRLYASHIAGLPLILLGLIAVHFYLIHVFNLAPTAWGPDSARADVADEPMARFSDHGVAILRHSALYYGAALVLAAVFPVGLGEAPGGPMAPIKPPWPFYWIYGLENLYGVKGIVVGQTLLAALLLALPFIDRGAERHPRARKLPLAVFGAAVAIMVALHTYAWIAPAQMHAGMDHDHGDAAHEHDAPAAAPTEAPHERADESAPAPAPEQTHPAEDHVAEPHDGKSAPHAPH